MSENDPRQVIWKHMQRIGTCMLVTRGETHVRARPMRAIIRPDQSVIWFITDASADAHTLAELAELRDHLEATINGASMRRWNSTS